MPPHRGNPAARQTPRMRAHLMFTNHYALPGPLSGLELYKDGLHGGEVGLEVLVGVAAFGVGGVVVAVSVKPGCPVFGGTRLRWCGGLWRGRVHGSYDTSTV